MIKLTRLVFKQILIVQDVSTENVDPHIKYQNYWDYKDYARTFYFEIKNLIEINNFVSFTKQQNKKTVSNKRVIILACQTTSGEYDFLEFLHHMGDFGKLH